MEAWPLFYLAKKNQQMKKLILCLLFVSLYIGAIGQVIPSSFPEETAPDTSNFEFYSQKGAVLKRTNLYHMRNYLDQDLSLSGDTIYISKRGTAGFVVLSPYSQTLAVDADTLSISGGNSIVLPSGGSTQSLSVSNDTISISGGNSIVVPRYVNTDGATLSGDSESTPIYLLDNAVTTTKIAAGGVGTTDIANNAVDFTKLLQVSSGAILGRSSSGTGNVESLTLGSGLSLSGGVLSASAAASSGDSYASITSGAMTVRVWYSGSTVPTLTGGAGVWTISIPSGTQLSSFRINGGSSILTGGGDISVILDWAGVAWNTSEADAMYPAMTLIETASASNIQVSNQGSGYQITHPSVSVGATTTTITGLSGLSTFTIIGNIK